MYLVINYFYSLKHFQNSIIMNNSKALLLLLSGLALGAAAGILLAPDEGAKTRKKLSKKAKKLKKSIRDTASGYKEKASDFKEKVTDFKDKVTDKASKVKDALGS